MIKTMKIRKFLVAGGNSTAIVWNCDLENRSKVVKELLNEVEQVGFVNDHSESFPSFTMMGNELSINGTIAFAFTLGGDGRLKASGVSEIVEYSNEGSITKISLPLKPILDDNRVLLEGIGYMVIPASGKRTPAKEELLSMCKAYDLPAFGLIVLEGNKITPYVYVKETNSLVEESACGSGSVAASIVSGEKTITQPTGEDITVNTAENFVAIEAKVNEILK